MSSNYSAQQYNDAFLPARLGNWEKPADRDYAQRPRKCRLHSQHPSSSPYFLVSDRNGRLLPFVKEQLMSRQENAAWTELSQFWFGGCGCSLKRKERNRKRQQDGEEIPNAKHRFPVPIPSFFRRVGQKRVPKSHKQQRPSTPRVEIDPYLVYLRDLALPTIWVLGVPTSTIRQKRKRLCQEIADELDFAYVELNDCIANWTRRQMEAERARCGEGRGNNDAKIDIPSATVPSYRSMKPKKLGPTQPHNPDNPVDFESSSFPFPSPPITFSTTCPFTTEKVLDLLKFAMVEALPANGFVLDGFPCNLQEAAEFERRLYPASLALYFVTGENGRNRLNEEDPLIFPTRFRRRLQFTFTTGDALCSRRNYGWKAIRVLDTENLDKDTVSFLHQVIRDNLDREYNKRSEQVEVGRGVRIDINGEEPLLTPMADEDINVISTAEESLIASPRLTIRRHLQDQVHDLDDNYDYEQPPHSTPPHVTPLEISQWTKKQIKSESLQQPHPVLIGASDFETKTNTGTISSDLYSVQKLVALEHQMELNDKLAQKKKNKKKRTRVGSGNQHREGGAGDGGIIDQPSSIGSSGGSVAEFEELPTNLAESKSTLKNSISDNSVSIIFQRKVLKDCCHQTTVTSKEDNTDNVEESKNLESQLKSEPTPLSHSCVTSPRKRENPDDRLLPLPSPNTSSMSDDSWWWNPGVAQGHKPKTPPASPDDNENNSKESPSTKPKRHVKTEVTKSMESMYEWFDKKGHEPREPNKVHDGDYGDTDEEFEEMTAEVEECNRNGCGDW